MSRGKVRIPNPMKRFCTKVGRFFWAWGFLKFVLSAVTLIVLLYVEEDWRGARAWAATKAKWEARGISFDFNRLIPPPVPADQNLAAIPLFKMELDPAPENKGNFAPLALRRAYSTKDDANTDANPLSLGNWEAGQLTDMEKVRRAVGRNLPRRFPVNCRRST